ncbi:nickel pincer cofactor biosynthesis protein LarB [Fuerstiella marisgermanici]|uniref:Phosphoribosylaminoimidazole carboxylase, catalytic subunit n=1 Tax=Fuerstiella marisgermanici TaxID=1891926 RepID=A0A1P8WAU2_9PLAN|nr:nickel pincer cofactor biosynthesis protein LarB [Fuerstiella marisgermanici]APZ91155.1 phosphoribosylaminoimidazole carboxylase, catalytic subunit [Fuerstiella marisgermanici]
MLPDSRQLRDILATFLPDPDALNSAVNAITSATTAEVPGAAVDIDRASRCGFPEVVYGEGKPAELIVEILQRQAAAGQAGFVTRVSPEQAAVVQQAFPNVHYNHVARTLTMKNVSAPGVSDAEPAVAVISAGSCDAAVAQESLETLRWMDVPAVLIEDVGVAGPQRLIKHVPLLQRMSAIVCVAGMEAALPSVVGGYVSCPIIGVPTSVGYGASFGGVTALLSMLTCCASNVVAVNIDGGFRGGYVAGMIATRAASSRDDD